jgi:hypothetical protein
VRIKLSQLTFTPLLDLATVPDLTDFPESGKLPGKAVALGLRGSGGGGAHEKVTQKINSTQNSMPERGE